MFRPQKNENVANNSKIPASRGRKLVLNNMLYLKCRNSFEVQRIKIPACVYLQTL